MSESIKLTIDEPQLVNRIDIPINKKINTDYDENSSEYIDCVDNSQLFLITIDDIPEYYVKTVDEADKCIWNIANQITKLNPNYSYRYVNLRNNNIHVERHHNFFLVSYDEVIHRIRYDVIRGIKLTKNNKEK